VSNIALFGGNNLPAFAKNAELSDMAKALAGGGGNSGKRISIKGGVFRLMSDGKEVAAIDERYLDIVIVKAAPKVARVFYAAKYDGDTAAAPDCWSSDGDVPDSTSKAAQADTCAACPQNIAGSGNGDSRACRYQQRLAVVLANDIEGSVMQLPLPATSIFGKEEGENRGLQAYARWLAAQTVNPNMVVTRMKFDTKAESPKLHFKAMRWLTEDEYATVGDQGETPDALKAITMSVAQIDKVKAPLELEGQAPKAKAKPPVEAEEDDEAPAPKPKAKAKAKPAPVEVDEDDEPPAPAPKAKAKPAPVEADEDEAEPEVRKAEKKPSAVPGKKSLADVVGGWDDED
jgi:hypothetical protein